MLKQATAPRQTIKHGFLTFYFEPRKRKTIAFKPIGSFEIQVLYPKESHVEAIFKLLLSHIKQVEKSLLSYNTIQKKAQEYEAGTFEERERWIYTAQKEITDRALFWSDKMGLNPSYIHIKEMKSRWGSCTGKNGINLNIRLFYTPKPVIDYVVIHELCHITHKNHQAAFWQAVETFDHEYLAHRKWLREKGKVVMEIPLGYQKNRERPC